VESEEEACAIVDGALGALREVGVEAQGKSLISQTDTAEAIASTVDEEKSIDLVVSASRRPSELSGMLLGSVAHNEIHRMSRPVLLASRVRTANGVRRRSQIRPGAPLRMDVQTEEVLDPPHALVLEAIPCRVRQLAALPGHGSCLDASGGRRLSP
jgi:Universal stress protein family